MVQTAPGTRRSRSSPLPQCRCVATHVVMEIEFDPAKRAATLKERGLDFLDVPKVLSGRTYTAVDDRHDYGEGRFITFGNGVLRIISTRYAHRKEIERVGLGRS